MGSSTTCTQSGISSENNNSSFVFDFGASSMHMTVPWPIESDHHHHHHHYDTTTVPLPLVSPDPVSLLAISQLSVEEQNSMSLFSESNFIYPPPPVSASLVPSSSSAAAAGAYDLHQRICTAPPQLQSPPTFTFLPATDFNNLTPLAGNGQPVTTYDSFLLSAFEAAGAEQSLATPFLDNASIISGDSDTSHHAAEEQQQQQEPNSTVDAALTPQSLSHFTTTTNTPSVDRTTIRTSYANWEHQARYPTWRLIRPHRQAHRRRRVAPSFARHEEHSSASSASGSGDDGVAWDLWSTGPEPQLAAPTTTDKGAHDRPQCTDCGGFFSRHRDLTRHRQTTHSSQRLHCRYCSKSYTRNDSRMRHERQCARSPSRMASSSSSRRRRRTSITNESTASTASSPSSIYSSPTLSLA